MKDLHSMSHKQGKTNRKLKEATDMMELEGGNFEMATIKML